MTNRTREETLSTLAGLLDDRMLSPDDFARRSKLDVISEHSAADAPSADVQPSTQGSGVESHQNDDQGLTTEDGYGQKGDTDDIQLRPAHVRQNNYCSQRGLKSRAQDSSAVVTLT